MSADTSRAFSRTALVLLATAIVIAATYALTPRFDPQQELAAQMQQAKSLSPSPASQAALRQAIGETQSGVPDFDRVKRVRSQMFARLGPLQRALAAIQGGALVPTDRELLDAARRQQQILTDMGPLQSVAYLGGNARVARFQVTFRKGPLLWVVALGTNGALENFGFGPVGVPTPQDYIDNYARFPWSERSARLTVQFAILLAAAAFGRLALRLRL